MQPNSWIKLVYQQWKKINSKLQWLPITGYQYLPKINCKIKIFFNLKIINLKFITYIKCLSNAFFSVSSLSLCKYLRTPNVRFTKNGAHSKDVGSMLNTDWSSTLISSRKCSVRALSNFHSLNINGVSLLKDLFTFLCNRTRLFKN